MIREFRPGFSTVLVALATVAAVVLAWFNLQQQRKFQPPDDGVTWQDTADGVVALDVRPESPAARAGIREGDTLKGINGVEISAATRVARVHYRLRVWSRAEYRLLRSGRPFAATVILEPGPTPPLRRYLELVGLLYLGIGLFVLLRRPNAPRALHFYLFCLASFVLYFYAYTGKFNNFDWTIYWSNVVAWLLQPALFLHFALVFPHARPLPETWLGRRRLAAAQLYAPGALLLLVHLGLAVDAIRVALPSLTLRWMLDRVELVYMAAYYLAAAAVLYRTYRRADTAIFRQQMKWVTRGTALAILPFTALYVVPYFLGVIPTPLMKFSVLALILLPLTFGYAIIRWRLMDVDILFRRGVAYTLATAALLGLYFALVALAGALVGAALPSAGTWGLVLAVVATAFLFQPLRSWIQDRLERYFYRERYDYRRTLVEFGRELSAEIDLDRMLARALERLSRTLGVEKVAVFLAEEGPGRDGSARPDRARLERSLGISYSGGLDLSFLDPNRPEFRRGHLFFENLRQAVTETPSAQRTIAELDLHYFLPCLAQGRTVAVLGLGKTVEGDFLSTEDVALLETLSGYLGTAIENARLYRRLERKVAEYERLKDFSENIVESINVGLLALDLEDRIESWNTQVELMFGVSRDLAMGHRIDQVFPADLVAELMRFRDDGGIHNLYKYRVKTSAGQERVFNVAVAPLVAKNFDMIGRLVIFDDITDRIELEQQLRQAEKLSSVGLMAAGVAHEVNTPLAVISSYAQMLAKQLSAEDPRWKLLDRITRATFRASEIVNNLLNFSRTGSAEFSEQDLDQVVGDTLALLEHQFRSGGVKVERRFSAEKPAVNGNAGKLQQVFLNLFLNSREAMPQGGTLRVETLVSDSAVRVEVTDSGQGIAREHIHRIYDPFFTTKAQRGGPPGRGGTTRPGTGLGLSVTYGIVQEHGGRISVESLPGRGATFVLEFPRARARTASPELIPGD